MYGHFDDLLAGNSVAAKFVERQKLQTQLEGVIDVNDRIMLHLREVVGAASFFQSCLSSVSKAKEGTFVSDEEDLKFLEGMTSSKHPIMMEAAWQYLQNTHFFKCLFNFMISLLETNIPALMEATNIPALTKASNINAQTEATNVPTQTKATNIPTLTEATNKAVKWIKTWKLTGVFVILVEEAGE
ncbi:hypothetical protein BJ741DRAFT_573239 [Chytriomyces cf. hyalinus JEL632]|nr:hypothetical protein BJ741DRAFT_573239 [Chytriomyces cf. hyalinus JEL632]